MEKISAKDILKIDDLTKYKLHLACRNEDGVSPLDEYVTDKNNWIGWNEWRRNRNDWTREYIFSLIEFYPKASSWLFGGVFKIVERYNDYAKTETGYKVQEVEEFKKFEGRLIISCYRPPGYRGRAFYLEEWFNEFEISEILPKIYDGEFFPGYQNINHDFSTLEVIFQNDKVDWKTALMNVKGVYLIIDKSNGKKYIGSAYGESGIWSRWSCYIGTGHGWNDQLTTLIDEKGLPYSRTNFKFTLLEVMLMNTADHYVLERESFWKNVLLSRDFGYNSN